METGLLLRAADAIRGAGPQPVIRADWHKKASGIERAQKRARVDKVTRPSPMIMARRCPSQRITIPLGISLINMPIACPDNTNPTNP